MSKRPLKIGLFLPFAEGLMGGVTACWADLLAMSQRAEELGFDSIWIADHLLMQRPGHEPRGAWECWSLVSALAAATQRVEIGTLVVSTAFRNPALLAKMADTVEEISGGRLILGLGTGYQAGEFRAFGYPYNHLVGRFEEAIHIIHGLLREGAIDFVGKFYQARECELRPRGPRPQGPPILVGATKPRMLQLTAKYADMWDVFVSLSGNRPERIPAFREQVDTACLDVGRDPATLTRTTSVLIGLSGAMGIPGVKADPITGSAEAVADVLRAYAREGIAHVQLVPDPFTLSSLEQLAPVLEILDRG